MNLEISDNLRDFIDQCVRTRCGFCKFECPQYSEGTTELECSRGRMLALDAVISDELDIADPELVHSIFRCTMCGYCATQCKLERDNLLVFEKIRQLIVENGKIPPSLRNMLQNTYRQGNPWGFPRVERKKWSSGLKLKHFPAIDSEFLLYIGSTASYDYRCQKVAKALVKILEKAHVDFAVLGNEEEDSGDDAKRVGEQGLFEYLVDINKTIFKKYNIKKIITISPHDYNIFRNEYHKYIDAFPSIYHYTQIIKELLDNGNLKLTQALNSRVTFHDPCNLARMNDEIEAPRSILTRIKGLEFVDMEYCNARTFCCGSGGGRMWLNEQVLRTEKSMTKIRFDQIQAVNPDIVATACPLCLITLEEESKVRSSGIEVMDIVEVVNRAIKQS